MEEQKPQRKAGEGGAGQQERKWEGPPSAAAAVNVQMLSLLLKEVFILTLP